MSESAFQLIQAFSALPPQERRLVLIELTRIAGADDSGLSDDELTSCGEQLFALYDAEEAQRGEAGAR